MSKGPKVFVREATGLVKDVSLLNVFAYNMNSQTVAVGVYEYVLILAFTPGADPNLSFLLALVFGTFFVGLYAFFTAAMPRSGGDFVFVSRSLTPMLGWVSSLVFWFSEAAFMGQSTGWIGSVYLSAPVALMGQIWNSSSLISLGAALASPYSTFGIGTIVLIGVGITVILGTRVHFRLQNLVFFIGLLGTFVIIGILLSSTSAQFIASFNRYAAPYSNSTDSYNSVIKSATGMGFTTAPFSWYATLVGTTAAFASVAFANFSTYSSGEMKQASKVSRQMTGMVGSMFLNAILSLIVANLIVGIASSQFVGAAYYLSTFSPQSWPFPVAPFLNLYVAMLTQSLVLNAIVAAAWIAWGIAISMILFIMMTRILFAWSFDRLIPKFFADVSDRFHTPVKGTISVIIVGEAFLFIMAGLPPAFLGYLGYALAASVLPTALLVSISGVVLPYRARRLYESSSISKYKIGPVPLITVTGLVSTAFVLMLTYFYLTDSALGVNTPQVLAIIGAAIAISVILYLVISRVRKREGLGLSLAFKEIPPE